MLSSRNSSVHRQPLFRPHTNDPQVPTQKQHVHKYFMCTFHFVTVHEVRDLIKLVIIFASSRTFLNETGLFSLFTVFKSEASSDHWYSLVPGPWLVLGHQQFFSPTFIVLLDDTLVVLYLSGDSTSCHLICKQTILLSSFLYIVIKLCFFLVKDLWLQYIDLCALVTEVRCLYNRKQDLQFLGR